MGRCSRLISERSLDRRRIDQVTEVGAGDAEPGGVVGLQRNAGVGLEPRVLFAGAPHEEERGGEDQRRTPSSGHDANHTRRGIPVWLVHSRTVERVIRFEKVTKTYPGQDHSALDDVTVELDKGEFAFLVGASGSGKSTFLRLVLREARPTSGRVYVAGKEINRLASWKVPRLRRQIGTVFQDFRLLPNKTVNENVAFALQVIGKSKSHIRQVVPETLELVGLGNKADRMPDELSGGEQQRVAIARAFVNRPMILIADEPTGNLDPTTSLDIMNLMERINATGTTVLMATHDAGIVDQMGKRVIELIDGQLVRDQAVGGYGLPASN